MLLFFVPLVSCLFAGVGSGDTTGPAVECGFMGYGEDSQVGEGLLSRTWARAVVLCPAREYSASCFTYVTVESAMIFNEVKSAVLSGASCAPALSHTNLLIQATHTHSGPGGYTSYTLYDVTTMGYRPQSFNALVSGITQAICTATQDITRVTGVRLDTVQVLNASISRSAAAYAANPAEERAHYEYNVDKNMTQLSLRREGSPAVSLLNWFATHGTSMNNTNRLISSDNKGYAAYLLEQRSEYIDLAIFANANEGDVSPNVLGAYCGDPHNGGVPCEPERSTCPGRSESCIGWGPGATMFDSAKIIGQRQADPAWLLAQKLATASTPAEGSNLELSGTQVRFNHQFVPLGLGLTVASKWTGTGQEGRTCAGALGHSFAAGTTDGPGAFNFEQATDESNANPFWKFAARLLHRPTPEQVACHEPKPILLDTQEMEHPAPWTAAVVPIQLFSPFPELVIIGVPGEFTTMAGRRLRTTVASALAEGGWPVPQPTLVVAGLSNEYTHYITTYEEYQVQRYEGASTLFGPHTLAAYLQAFDALARALARGEAVEPGPMPFNPAGTLRSFQPPVIVDTVPPGRRPGDFHTDVPLRVAAGTNVTAVFWAGNLRNNLLTNSSFMYVVRESDGARIRNDNDWDTVVEWRRKGIAQSLVTVTWRVPEDPALVGQAFRIMHQGYFRHILEDVTPYQGLSSPFLIMEPGFALDSPFSRSSWTGTKMAIGLGVCLMGALVLLVCVVCRGSSSSSTGTSLTSQHDTPLANKPTKRSSPPGSTASRAHSGASTRSCTRRVRTSAAV